MSELKQRIIEICQTLNKPLNLKRIEETIISNLNNEFDLIQTKDTGKNINNYRFKIDDIDFLIQPKKIGKSMFLALSYTYMDSIKHISKLKALSNKLTFDIKNFKTNNINYYYIPKIDKENPKIIIKKYNPEFSIMNKDLYE